MCKGCPRSKLLTISPAAHGTKYLTCDLLRASIVQRSTGCLRQLKGYGHEISITFGLDVPASHICEVIHRPQHATTNRFPDYHFRKMLLFGKQMRSCDA